MTGSKKIKVLMITVRADYGGGPEHVYRLLELLHSKIDIFIACPRDYPYWERYASILGSDRLFEIPHRKFSINMLVRLNNFSRRNKIEIIHSHGKGAGIYGRFLTFISSLPCVYTFHGIHTGKYSATAKFLYILIEKILSFFTTKFISVSKSEKERAVAAGIAPLRKIMLIENGVKIPDRTISSSILDEPLKKAASITRFDFQKNTGALLDAAKLLRVEGNKSGIRFIVIGSGSEEEEIKRNAADSGLDSLITFTGFTDNPGSYLIDSFCYISTSRWEGMPLGILEAMAFGLPVIATNVTGNKDVVVHGENGFLYNPAKPSEAVDYLKTLANDKELWKKMSSASRKLAEEKFNVSVSAMKTLEVYKQILNKNQK